MGCNLKGADARIWELHDRGFSVAAIASMTGKAEWRVRDVIVGAWLDDKRKAE